MSNQTKYNLIFVEGAHDLAFVTKVLKSFLQFKEVKEKIELKIFPQKHIFWEELFPKNIRLFHEIIRFPSILHDQEDSRSVAIKLVGGKCGFIEEIKDTFKNYEKYKTEISSLGIILDADDKDQSKVSSDIITFLQEAFHNQAPNISGEVYIGNPNIGIYVFPNNKSSGTLEDLLIECITDEHPYNSLKTKSVEFIDAIMQDTDYKKNIKSIKNFEVNKAKVAAMVSVLKPGKTNQTSISDDKWITEKSLQANSDLKSFYIFLRELLGFPFVERHNLLKSIQFII